MKLFFLFFICLIPAHAFGFTYTVSEVKGKEAFVLSHGSSYRAAALPGMLLQEGETLQTGVRSLIFLTSSNGHKISLGPNSSISLREAGRDKGTHFNLIELINGSVRSIIEKGNGETKKFELRRGNLNIGVGGTDFLTVVEGEGLDIFLNEGKVFLQNKVALTEGNRASITASGEIVRTASMSRFEFARAIERAGFGSDNDEGGGAGAPARKKDSTEDLIRKGDTAGLKALQLSPSELNDLGNGEGALHVAARNGRTEVIAWALEKRADVNGLDTNGKTPLVVAIERKHIPSIRALLAAGGDKKIKDGSGRNAFDYARLSESREIQNLLSK